MNRRTGLILLALALLPPALLAQAGDTAWARAIGDGELRSFATDVYADGSGFSYFCGRAQPPGGSAEELVVAKLNEWGDPLWVRYLGGSAPDGADNIGHALAVDLLGNVYVAGALDNSPPADRDMVVAKFSPDGDSLWTWVSGIDDDDMAFGIAVGNNQVYVSGVTPGDGYGAFAVARLNEQTGALVWLRDTMLDPLNARTGREPRRLRTDRYPEWYQAWDDWDNCGTAIAIAPNDGRVVATGYGYHGLRDFQMWTMKYDTAGTRLWSQHHGRTTVDYDDAAFDLAVVANGDIYIAGMGEADASAYDWLVIRMSSGGVFLNSATLNAPYNADEWATAIAIDNASPQNLYVTGFLDYGPAQGAERIVTMKYSNELVARWGAAGAQYQSHGGNYPHIGYDVHHAQGHVYVTGQSGPTGNELALLCYTDANASPKYEKWVKTVALEPGPGSSVGSAVYARDTTRIFVAGQKSRGQQVDSLQMMALRFFLPRRDVKPDSLLAPAGTVGEGQPVVPRVRVRNPGNDRSSFEVRLRIGDAPGYHDTTYVSNLLPGATAFAVFDTWRAAPAETLDIMVTTALAGDQDPTNDTLFGRVVVVPVSDRDVGVVEILAPKGTADSGRVEIPTAIVRNYGSEEVSFPTYFRIGTLYFDSTRVTLGAGASDTVRFRDWLPERLGWQVVMCFTRLEGDINPANDMLRDSVEVLPQVGVEEPAGLPIAFALEGVRPTPFRGGTGLSYALPQAAEVRLTVHNAAGRAVRQLARGVVPAGRHAARWDGRDDAGRPLGAGVYVCRFEAGGVVQLRKLVKLD